MRHIHEYHGASQPQLLQGNSILEQNFSRNKGASFEPLTLDEIMQGCRVGDLSATFIDPIITEQARQKPSSPARNTRPSTPKKQEPTGGTRKQTKTQRKRAGSSNSDPAPQGPRLFRLSPLVPFLSTRIYYLRSAIPASLFPDGKAVLEEIPKSYIASLVMSSGLVGMAPVRFPINVKREGAKGPVELTLDEDDD